mgnify:FL=1
MITINNTIMTSAISVLLAASVVLSSTKVFASANDSSGKMIGSASHLTIDSIEQVMSKGPQLVVMWSLECPACFDELDAIAQLLKIHPNLPITLISTDDDPSRSEEISEVYAEPAFGSISRWVYSPNQGQQLRYAIDSTWQGELPRSFYVDEKGKRHGHSGLLTQQQLMGIVNFLK